ncbi:MAG: hypothetical protein MPN21_02035 [Thermoanaerobaculia bacterium]|nr:hypothetical protein [Thermoanaerobaculia bacterium]
MRRFFSLLTAFALLSLLLAGCQAGSPEEQVAAKRAQYTVSLNSWYPELENEAVDEAADSEAGDEVAEGEAAETPTPEGEAAETPTPVGDGAGDEASTDVAIVDLVPGPQPHTIVFDLLVLYDGRGEALQGITVEVTQAGASGAEKASWLEYLELPAMSKGVSEQVGFQKTGVLFEEGDVFAVNLNKSVPPAERSQYREFQSAGS